MIIKEEFRTGIKDIAKEGLISNKAILEILENIACYHSDMVGYGPLDVQKTQSSWILLEWQVKVINRPTYGDKIEARTWARTFSKVFTYRDFEIYDKSGNLCIIATSKWVLVHSISRRIIRIPEEISSQYDPEEKQVFPEDIVEKIEEPEEYIEKVEYTARRRDIDINKHIHNIYYLDLADEVLPKDVYEKGPFNNFIIIYKKGIKLGETVLCRYGLKRETHIIKIENSEKKTNAIIKLW